MLERLTAETFCEGRWELCSADTVKPFSAVGYSFAEVLQRELNVPIGLINVSIGGTPTEAWVRRETLAADPQLASIVHGNWLGNQALGQWCRKRGAYNLSLAMQNGESIPGDDLGPNHSYKPGFMWESAVAPLIPFPIRGVIVKSDGVGRPRHLRYGWRPFPKPPLNLVNSEGLPASPFTTVIPAPPTQGP